MNETNSKRSSTRGPSNTLIAPGCGHGLVVELFGSDPNGRKMIAWGRRIGCRDAGHGFEPGGRGVYTRLLVNDAAPQQHSFLMELVDNPVGLRAINRAE